jgi:hypothetical protein
MTSGISIRGRVSFEGAAKNNLPDIASLRAGMTMDTPSVTTWDSPLPVGNSGPIRDNTFTISGIQPGSYRLGIRPILSVEISPPYNRPQEIPEALANMYVKSARLGGQDALSGGVLIGNETRTEFDVVIGTNGGIVDGVVLDSRLQPVPNSVAVLIPASVALRDRTDLYKSVTTDETGRFKLRGIAPGDYKVFAFDYAEPGIWKNPDFIRPLESRSKSVSVSEGSNVRVDLSLTEVRQ